MQGPITVVDAGNYAGDAQIEDIAQGDTRLISYAVDLDTEVAVQPRQEHQTRAVRIVKGVLTGVDKIIDERVYRAKNSSETDRTLLVEQVVLPEFKLAEPSQAAEETASLYRFELALPSGKSQELKVRTERTLQSETALVGLDSDSLLVLVRDSGMPPKLREALGELQQRRMALADIERQSQAEQRSIEAISEEQNRIRQNMPQLDKTSELYQRYVKMFSEQEDKIAATRTRLAELAAQREARQRELDDYLAKLDVE